MAMRSFDYPIVGAIVLAVLIFVGWKLRLGKKAEG